MIRRPSWESEIQQSPTSEEALDGGDDASAQPAPAGHPPTQQSHPTNPARIAPERIYPSTGPYRKRRLTPVVVDVPKCTAGSGSSNFWWDLESLILGVDLRCRQKMTAACARNTGARQSCPGMTGHKVSGWGCPGLFRSAASQQSACYDGVVHPP